MIRFLVAFSVFLSLSTGHAQSPQPALSTLSTLPAPAGLIRWTCNAFYLPARSIWQRTVGVEFDASGVHAVQIDGVPVYTFTVQGTTLLTAVDAERVQFDTALQAWTSDLRGIVSSQGRCERLVPAE